jgi:hypothetical protein
VPLHGERRAGRPAAVPPTPLFPFCGTGGPAPGSRRNRESGPPYPTRPVPASGTAPHRARPDRAPPRREPGRRSQDRAAARAGRVNRPPTSPAPRVARPARRHEAIPPAAIDSARSRGRRAVPPRNQPAGLLSGCAPAAEEKPRPTGANSGWARHQPMPCARLILSIRRVLPTRPAIATMVRVSADGTEARPSGSTMAMYSTRTSGWLLNS